MRANVKNIIRTRFVKSYVNGMAKSMDANNDILVFHKPKRASIYTAWEDVGKDISDVMKNYESSTNKSAQSKVPAYE